MDDKTINEHLSRLSQAIARLERKTDFILDHLHLTFVDTPSNNIPPELREVAALLQQGKKLEAIQAYRKSLELNPRNENASAQLEKLTAE